MNLLTAAEFAKLAGVSQKTISICLNPKDEKEPRLDYYNGTKKLDTDSVKARAFLENIAPQRGSTKAIIDMAGSQPAGDQQKSDDLTDALITSQNASAKKTIEEARLKEQRIEKQLKNAVRRGELIELEAVNQMIMTWFDQWLQANKRGFNGSFDAFLRDAFLLFENEQSGSKKDYKPHKITRAELKRKWSTLFESWADDGKEASVERLNIQIEQAKRK